MAGYVDLSQKKSRGLSDVLITKNAITDQELLSIKSELYKLPVVNLSEVGMDKQALKSISEDVVSFYKIVPFGMSDTVLQVGIINPEDINALEALKFIASDRGLTLEKYLISTQD